MRIDREQRSDIIEQNILDANMAKNRLIITDSPYISPKELAMRWCCARSSVDRIARKAGFTRMCLGHGKNGAIRYLRDEVILFEKKRMIQMSPDKY